MLDETTAARGEPLLTLQPGSFRIAFWLQYISMVLTNITIISGFVSPKKVQRKLNTTRNSEQSDNSLKLASVNED